MEIRIALFETDPPRGSVQRLDEIETPPRDFSGWIGLLGVLYELLPAVSPGEND